MRKSGLFLTGVSLAILFFLYLPLMAVAFFSVNSSRYGLVWKNFTFDWYVKMVHDEYILHAAFNTLVLALISTAVSTVLGTALAIGMENFPWSKRLKAFLDTVLNLPVVTPDIILAAALVVVFGLLRLLTSVFDPGMLTMVIGHITFQTAFVALVVRSRIAAIGPNVEAAARDLYADNFYILRHVTLPLLMPGIVAGAMLAFTLSLDDFVISFFTSGPTSVTLPLLIYASVRRGVTPEIHALSTVILVLTVVLVFAFERLSRRPGRVD
jgi:spermidine/putrescine transport system permease protein